MKITIKQAAKLINKSELFVRCGLQSGKLPIGSAFQMSGKSFSYSIAPGYLAAYLGITVERLEEAINESDM